jgi:hypothetical protein
MATLGEGHGFLEHFIMPRLVHLKLDQRYATSQASQGPSLLHPGLFSIITHSGCLENPQIGITIPPADLKALLRALPNLLSLDLTNKSLPRSILSMMAAGAVAPKLTRLVCVVRGGRLDDHLNMLEERASEMNRYHMHGWRRGLHLTEPDRATGERGLGFEICAPFVAGSMIHTGITLKL